VGGFVGVNKGEVTGRLTSLLYICTCVAEEWDFLKIARFYKPGLKEY